MVSLAHSPHLSLPSGLETGRQWLCWAGPKGLLRIAYGAEGVWGPSVPSPLTFSPSYSYQLAQRTFHTFDFYKKHQEAMTPAGLAFFQCRWDDSVTHTFHQLLGRDSGLQRLGGGWRTLRPFQTWQAVLPGLGESPSPPLGWLASPNLETRWGFRPAAVHIRTSHSSCRYAGARVRVCAATPLPPQAEALPPQAAPSLPGPVQRQS